jgi:2-polyprenyl-6-hydroxyphenyl methylase/3-demethylubiquinone-9 3-methyltransferase
MDDTKTEWERMAASWTRQAENPNNKFTKLIHNVVRLIDRHVRPGRSLDIGCGPGLLCQLLLERGFDAYGTDIAENMVRAAVERLTPTVPDAASRFALCLGEAIPFGEARFNLITAIQVLPYIARYTPYIQRLASRLEPGGFIVASSTNRFSLFAMHEIMDRLLRLPPHVRTIRNLARTGYHSGGNVNYWKSEQAYNAGAFDRLVAAQGFGLIDAMEYYHIQGLDADPLNRHGWNRRFARRLAWHHVGVYQKGGAAAT